YSGAPLTDLAAWQSASGQGANSLSFAPQYLSETNLHAQAPALATAGVFLAAVPDDIDGEVRGDPPSIGADEYIAGPDQSGSFATVELTAGSYSIDVVAEDSPAATTTNETLDGTHVLYATTHPNAPGGTGMPADYSVSTSEGLPYSLRDYTQTNVATVGSGDVILLSFETPTTATQLHFLAASANGKTPVDITVVYTDNSTLDIANRFFIQDWLADSTFAHTPSGYMEQSTEAITASNTDYPRLFSYTFNLPGSDESKLIRDIIVSGSTSNSAGQAFVFAVSRTTFAALPVELVAWRAEANDAGQAHLSWRTASESDNERFDVQRSQDGTVFETIGSVTGHGTTVTPKSYTFIDESPGTGINYYRLRQVDYDGAVEFTETRSVFITESQTSSVKVFPNPLTAGVLTVRTVNHKLRGARLHLYGPAGRLVRSRKLRDRETKVPVSDLPSGMYVLTIGEGPHMKTRRILIQ
ncbi:hypothetical protein GGR28_002374, partial [Lewinella aquimaris]